MMNLVFKENLKVLCNLFSYARKMFAGNFFKSGSKLKTFKKIFITNFVVIKIL